jgi:addiction module HigA family antidote
MPGRKISISRAALDRDPAALRAHSTGAELAPVPPGEVLREEFLAPLGLSARALAREIGVPPNRVTGILNGTRAITAETALRLAARFGASAEFWMLLQAAHDLEIARRTARTLRVRRAGAERRTAA